MSKVKGKDKVDPEALEASLTKLEAVEKEFEAVEKQIVRQQVKMTAPIFQKRSEIVRKIPGFWKRVILAYPLTEQLFANEEEKSTLEYLENVELVRDEIEPDSYKVIFTFNENPYFKNSKLVKEIKTDADGNKTSISAPIDWKEGKRITKSSSKKDTKEEQDEAHEDDEEELSFFEWIETTEGDISLADLVRDDLYANAIRYFLNEHTDDKEGEQDEKEDEENEEPPKKKKKGDK
ncbi:uncharacterized protein VTP21DRAFT_9029 [Calcarisporiella thermophila]|uniref:uncharacterized protein n=1 Tax=Calcarisporiella thermophila TaxID=911321 RepID=UPI0037444C98